MILYLDRLKFLEQGTVGVLSTDGDTKNPLCYTLELPWHNNEHGISCIPVGAYKCIPHNSPAHPHTWEVTGVPNRSAILIHSGNTINDLKGCIAVGDSMGELDGLPAVRNSKITMEKLSGMLPDNFMLNIEE